MKIHPQSIIMTTKSSRPTITLLCKITLKNGSVIALNQLDKDIFFDGTLYPASNALSASATKTESTLAVDTTDLEGMINTDLFDEGDIAGGLFNGAYYEFYEVNYMHPEGGGSIVDTGFIGDLGTSNTGFKLELRSIDQNVQSDIGRIFMPACDANLGDSRCRVDLNAITVSGSVQSSDYNFYIIDNTRTENSGYFNGGLLKFSSGDNMGLSVEVKNYDKETGRIDFQANFPRKIKAGDTYIMHPGCDKRRDTCRDKYNNIINFRGVPSIPAAETLLSIW